MNKWIAEFELEDGDTMPEHMDLEYKGVRIDFHCKPLEQEPYEIIKEIPKDYKYDTETEDFLVYRNKYTGQEIHIEKPVPRYRLEQEPRSEWEHDHEILKAYSDGVNEVLDKIKENIQFIKDKCLPNTIAEEYEQKGLQEALDIIDKYMAESENS